MKETIVLTGATGFVGKKLALEIVKRGYELRVITRNIAKAKKLLPLPCTFHEWDGYGSLPVSFLEKATAIIHLAGEPIAENRWSPSVKKRIEESRSIGTSLIMEALKKCVDGPKIVIGTSAIGIYGDRGDEVLNEDSTVASSFLANVCKKWERSYGRPDARLVILRVGVVLGHGGALEKMLPPFRLGAGGRLATGKQWMSWIHRDDLVNLYLYALENPKMEGTFNAVSPQSVTNADFTQSLARALMRPAFFPVPAFIIKVLFGEMSQVLLDSQNVSSKKVKDCGFNFKFPDLNQAFEDLLRPLGHKGAHVFEAFQWIPKPRDEVFPFFSEAQNLEKITPEWLNFTIKNLPQNGIREGALIDYRLLLKGIPIKWRTLISSWKPNESFVDEQLKGPYKIWHHTHKFKEVAGGTLMTDRIVYKISFGPIGDIVRLLIVKKDVEKIFNFRTDVINKQFTSEVV